MTTPRARATVSLAVMMAVTLALGACIRGPSRGTFDAPAAEYPLAIRFDNDAREHVHVYLIAEQRQWLLGRVEPGARAMLLIPEASLVGSRGLVQLAVLTGERVTLQAAHDSRATFTIAQSASEIMSQRWRFTQGQLTSLAIRGRDVK